MADTISESPNTSQRRYALSCTSAVHSPQSPFILIIPSFIVANHNLLPGAQMHYGYLCGLAEGPGYCWASDEELGNIEGKDPSTISRYNRQLESEGYIVLETKSVRYTDHNERLLWKKKRRIFIRPQGVEVNTTGTDEVEDTNVS